MDSTHIKKPARGIYLLPNMLTTLSMFAGFLAIVWSCQGRFEASGFAILASGLMDGLDGKVARLTHTASEFGVQYDSLADLVAFGLAPAILLWNWQLHILGRVGVAAAFIYVACGALRLARFNVTTCTLSKRFFIGLPIPAAGFTLCTFVFFARLFPEAMQNVIPCLAIIIAIGCGLLMVSTVSYFSFKEFDIFRTHVIATMLAFLFLLGLLVSFPRLFSFFYCLLYIGGGLAYAWIIAPRKARLSGPEPEKH